MPIPTEPIGSIPRPHELLEGIEAFGAGTSPGKTSTRAMTTPCATRSRASRPTGSPVITDGEQRKPSFVTYPIHGLETLAPDGVTIPFADGHARQLPRLTAGPFRYRDLRRLVPRGGAAATPTGPVKQAVISASALSLLYPQDGHRRLPARGVPRRPRGRGRERHPALPRAGRDSVQIDFTEGRLAVKLDPSKGLLRLLRRPEQPRALAVHAARSAAGSASTPAPAATGLDAQRRRRLRRAAAHPLRAPGRHFYIQLASETDRPRVLRDRSPSTPKPDQRIFVGVIDPIDPRIETPEEVRDRVLEAARVHPRRTPRDDRRLRLRAVRRRHLDRARHGVREDPRPGRRHEARGGGAGALGQRAVRDLDAAALVRRADDRVADLGWRGSRPRSRRRTARPRRRRRSLRAGGATSWRNVSPQPTMWPGGHQYSPERMVRLRDEHRLEPRARSPSARKT